jgi:anti-anti-sigma factor
MNCNGIINYRYIIREDNMLSIEKKTNGDLLTIALTGRLDTVTASDLEKVIDTSLENVKELIMDFEKLDYISSAGLRILISAQKIMNNNGSMKVVKVNESIMEIFEVTGFADILTIE